MHYLTIFGHEYRIDIYMFLYCIKRGDRIIMKRVLIVDDADFMRISLKAMLEKYKFEVVGEASNGLEAIKMYNALRPDVVTMDITMPDMDGLEAMKIIKSIDENAKVIMLSAMGQKTIVLKAITEGAAGFIVKPFNEAHVAETLRKI